MTVGCEINVGMVGDYNVNVYPTLAALVALIETEAPKAPTAARTWLADLVRFSRRAQERGVGVTFIVSG